MHLSLLWYLHELLAKKVNIKYYRNIHLFDFFYNTTGRLLNAWCTCSYTKNTVSVLNCFMTFPIGDLSVNIRMISPNEPHAGVSNSVLD